MHALAQGAAQAVEVIAAIRAGIDLLLCAPGRPAQRRIEETLGAAACPRLVRTGRTGGLERAPGRPSLLARGRRNAARPRRRRLRRAPSDLARARGAGADQARSRGRRRRARADRLRPRHADPRDHARADRPDPGRHLVGRPARARRGRCGRGSRPSTTWSCRSPRATPRSAACGRAPSRSMPSSSGPSRRTASRARRRSSGRSPRPGRRPSRSRCARRGTRSSTRRACPRSRRTRSCPIRSRRSRARSRARSGSRAGSRSRSRPAPMTLRDEIREQPEVAARFLAEQAGNDRVDRRVAARSAAAARRHRRARHLRPRRGLRAVRARGPTRIDGRARGAIDRVDLRRDAGRARRARDRHQPVGGVAGHRRGRRRGARRRARRRSRSPTSPIPRWRAAADRTIALGAGPERAIAATKTYTAELLAIAVLSAALADDPADVAAVAAIPDTLARVLDARTGDRADRAPTSPAATRALVIARGYEYATAREWALKLKELARVFADPYSAADFQHGPLALVEPGVPVLAVARPGAPGRRSCRAPRAPARSTSVGSSWSSRTHDRGAGPRDVAGPRCPPARPSGSDRSSRSWPGQLHALHLTRARGLDPERPRNLIKVTRTT